MLIVLQARSTYLTLSPFMGSTIAVPKWFFLSLLNSVYQSFLLFITDHLLQILPHFQVLLVQCYHSHVKVHRGAAQYTACAGVHWCLAWAPALDAVSCTLGSKLTPSPLPDPKTPVWTNRLAFLQPR